MAGGGLVGSRGPDQSALRILRRGASRPGYQYLPEPDEAGRSDIEGRKPSVRLPTCPDFANLTGLHTLVIDLDGLSSLHGLENLTGLTELDVNCRSSSIADLSPLANMGNLVDAAPVCGQRSRLSMWTLWEGWKILGLWKSAPAGRIGDTSALAHVPEVLLRN